MSCQGTRSTFRSSSAASSHSSPPDRSAPKACQTVTINLRVRQLALPRTKFGLPGNCFWSIRIWLKPRPRHLREKSSVSPAHPLPSIEHRIMRTASLRVPLCLRDSFPRPSLHQQPECARLITKLDAPAAATAAARPSPAGVIAFAATGGKRAVSPILSGANCFVLKLLMLPAASRSGLSSRWFLC